MVKWRVLCRIQIVQEVSAATIVEMVKVSIMAVWQVWDLHRRRNQSQEMEGVRKQRVASISISSLSFFN